MSRHTLNDDITPDTTITDNLYEKWWPELAPPPRLLGDYYKRGLVWVAFAKSFNDYLKTQDVHDRIIRLAELAAQDNVAILCTESTPELCHRRLIVEHVQLLIPEINTQIN